MTVELKTPYLREILLFLKLCIHILQLLLKRNTANNPRAMKIKTTYFSEIIYTKLSIVLSKEIFKNLQKSRTFPDMRVDW